MNDSRPTGQERTTQPVEQPTAVLVLTAFQDTPWAHTVRRAADARPQDAIAIFNGLAGLYWAYAQDIPFDRHLQDPTKGLITEIVMGSAGYHGYSTAERRERMLAVANHLQSFITMWVGVQSEDVRSRRGLRYVIDALHADTASRLDTMEYENEWGNPLLLQIVQQFTGLGPTQAADTPPYKALTRHFATGGDAPPVTVSSEPLRVGLNFVRDRYRALLSLPEYQPDAEAQELMQRLLGARPTDQPLSLRELRLRQSDPNADARQQTYIESMLQALTDQALLAQLRTRGTGELAVRTANPDRGTQQAELNTRLWELVTVIQAGGEAGREAFGALYQEAYKSIYRLVFKRLRDPDLAEEYTAVTFERAIKAIGRLKNNGDHVMAWLSTIARNVCLDYLGSKQHNFEVLTDEVRDPTGGASRHTIADTPLTPEQLALKSVLRGALVSALGKLTNDTHRTCIVLRLFEQRNVQETAQLMGMSEPAVRSLQVRALLKLRKILIRDHPGLAQAYLGKRTQKQKKSAK